MPDVMYGLLGLVVLMFLLPEVIKMLWSAFWEYVGG